LADFFSEATVKGVVSIRSSTLRPSGGPYRERRSPEEVNQKNSCIKLLQRRKNGVGASAPKGIEGKVLSGRTKIFKQGADGNQNGTPKKGVYF